MITPDGEVDDVSPQRAKGESLAELIGERERRRGAAQLRTRIELRVHHGRGRFGRQGLRRGGGAGRVHDGDCGADTDTDEERRSEDDRVKPAGHPRESMAGRGDRRGQATRGDANELAGIEPPTSWA